MNKETIDQEWETKKLTVKNRTSKPTTKQDIISYMFQNKAIWYWSYDFTGKFLRNGKRLSHRADARASDLARLYPEWVECRKTKGFACYRLRYENIKVINDNTLSNIQESKLKYVKVG